MIVRNVIEASSVWSIFVDMHECTTAMYALHAPNVLKDSLEGIRSLLNQDNLLIIFS